MIRVNVGLSRKLSKDYNSTGYSINIDGEITATVSDATAVIEEVKQLYDLAEEVLDLQIERSQGDAAMASRDEPQRSTTNAPANGNGHSNGNGRGNGRQQSSGNEQSRRPNNGQRNGGREPEPATNKQVQYLLSIGKRKRLSTVQLEREIEHITGETVGVYDLSKRQAAQVIDALTSDAPAGGSNSRF